jgi:flagellar FliL protein
MREEREMAKKKAADGDEAKGGKGKTLAMAAVMVIGVLGGLKGFVLSGGKAAAAPGVSTTTTTKPGPIVTLDPITVNIAGDRFLKVGLGLQLSGKLAGQPAPKDSNDPTKGFARALDLTIETFGGHTYESLVKPEGRAAAKEELVKKLEAAYPEEVEGVYFTDFVMQ